MNHPLTTLKSLTLRRLARTRRKSSFDTTGGNRDWWPIAVGETITLADLKGAGYITHLWFTINAPDDCYYLRHLVLAAYWMGTGSLDRGAGGGLFQYRAWYRRQ